MSESSQRVVLSVYLNTKEERELLDQAASRDGARSVSRWARDTLLDAAEQVTSVVELDPEQAARIEHLSMTIEHLYLNVLAASDAMDSPDQLERLRQLVEQTTAALETFIEDPEGGPK